MYEGGNLLMSWLTDADDGQTGGVEGVGVHSRGDGVDDNGASNVGGTGAESGINGLPDDVVANALPAGVATIDEVNDWPGSGDVIGIAAQGDGVYSPVGMAGAINGALPENNRSSVQSDPGVYENSVGKSYRGPGIVGNDDGGDGSKRNTNDPNDGVDGAGSKRYKNDPNDGARPKRYTIGQRYHIGDDETSDDDVTLVKRRMDDDDQLQLLTTAPDEARCRRTPGSQATLRRQLGVLFVQEEMFGYQCGSVSDTDPAQTQLNICL